MMAVTTRIILRPYQSHRPAVRPRPPQTPHRPPHRARCNGGLNPRFCNAETASALTDPAVRPSPRPALSAARRPSFSSLTIRPARFARPLRPARPSPRRRHRRRAAVPRSKCGRDRQCDLAANALHPVSRRTSRVRPRWRSRSGAVILADLKAVNTETVSPRMPSAPRFCPRRGP